MSYQNEQPDDNVSEERGATKQQLINALGSYCQLKIAMVNLSYLCRSLEQSNLDKQTNLILYDLSESIFQAIEILAENTALIREKLDELIRMENLYAS